ncbi:MAG TPA: sigma-70 family RNA polymerase sigma factor [Jatrophihabitantaceae bacterium]|nr:sigma-70 family RNA polymerase sigma factor [Jatrophihabitantaceae bacterium]
MDRSTEDLLRQLTPQVLGALTRRYGHFDLCEDAVQEALLAAATQWPSSGRPDSPRGWLITVASRRLVDELRADSARARREANAAVQADFVAAPADAERMADSDDTLTLLFLCCHPSLSGPSQLALTLRAVGGLTTLEIARAFFVPESTMAQRISRAKQRLRDASFALPPPSEYPARLQVVLHVLYLIFNEGYTTSSGPSLQRSDMTGEAIRLARSVHRALPDDGEVSGLLALMLLTDSRRLARTTPDGALVPLADQDRSQWDGAAIDEGVALVSGALERAPLGPYQLQAAIAALHASAPSSDETDWRQIVALYDLLGRLAPNPMVTLNQAVAVAMVDGPAAGLEVLAQLDGDERLAEHHRLDAVRGHLLELAGSYADARRSYLAAARRTTSIPEQRYLQDRAAALA